jgi:hypothetical protein
MFKEIIEMFFINIPLLIFAKYFSSFPNKVLVLCTLLYICFLQRFWCSAPRFFYKGFGALHLVFFTNVLVLCTLFFLQMFWCSAPNFFRYTCFGALHLILRMFFTNVLVLCTLFYGCFLHMFWCSASYFFHY